MQSNKCILPNLEIYHEPSLLIEVWGTEKEMLEAYKVSLSLSLSLFEYRLFRTFSKGVVCQ